VSPELFTLCVVVVTALAFDFTNGFHDTGNAMATSIATGALKPKVAVGLSAALNLVGAFLSVEVAATVAKGIVNLDKVNIGPGDGKNHMLLLIVFCGLVGGILWNLLTWLFGLPSSSSHALFGGLIGAALISLGKDGVVWGGVVGKIIIPAVLAPIVAGIVSAIATALVYLITRKVEHEKQIKGFRWGQILSASLISLSHGTNDAQKTMGVIFLALVAYGRVNPEDGIPVWVKICCALAIALGTYIGGWRVIRTLGKGLVEIESPQGMAAEMATASVILTSSHFGLALSTTHVATGSILGTGLGRKNAEVRWGVAGRMVIAWIITLPAAAIVGALTYLLGHYIGLYNEVLGVIVVFIILVIAASYIFYRSLKTPVNANNVNDDWDDHKSSKDSRASKLSTQLPTAEKNIIPQQQEITQQQEQGDNH
jgi:putative phosphate transport protein pitA